MTRNDLILKIKQASRHNDKEFQEVIAAVLDGGFLRENELAQEVGTSLLTIYRWRDGINAPHPFLRPHLFKRLIKKLQETDSKQ